MCIVVAAVEKVHEGLLCLAGPTKLHVIIIVTNISLLEHAAMLIYTYISSAVI